MVSSKLLSLAVISRGDRRKLAISGIQDRVFLFGIVEDIIENINRLHAIGYRDSEHQVAQALCTVKLSLHLLHLQFIFYFEIQEAHNITFNDINFLFYG